MKTNEASVDLWHSPGEVMDMLFDVRTSGCEDVGYALLRPRARGVENSAGALVRGKLAPVKPAPGSAQTSCGIAVTARDHRLVLASGVADQTIARLLDDYDAHVRPHQRLLAAVLTLRGELDAPMHDLFDAAVGYASLHLAQRHRLTSVVVLHAPGDELSVALPHVHLCILARQHYAAGWSAQHPDLCETAHMIWAEEWHAFRQSWKALALTE